MTIKTPMEIKSPLAAAVVALALAVSPALADDTASPAGGADSAEAMEADMVF